MWKVVKGKRKSAFFDVIHDDTWLEREGKESLWRYGIGREMQESFLFEKVGLKFSFYAERWDEKAYEPTDVYIVPIALCDNVAAIIDHAKDVESGLLTYPLHRDWEGVPAREVLFDINPMGCGMRLVRAEEVR
jgi:hypothetical protein